MAKKLHLKGSFESLNVSSATVGQTIKVASVDDNGKPLTWEAVDLPEQVQSDWNQDDETSYDYVKNRPFYDDGFVETELFDVCALVEESGASWLEDQGVLAVGALLGQELLLDTPLTIGDKYSIQYNGAIYECAAVDGSDIIGVSGSVVVGDIDGLMSGGWIYGVLIIVGPYNLIDSADTSGRYGLLLVEDVTGTTPTELKVFSRVHKMKKIDEKFLEFPDNVKNSSISINGKNVDEDNNLELVPSDIGASKIIYVTETDGVADIDNTEINSYIESGNEVRLIPNTISSIVSMVYSGKNSMGYPTFTYMNINEDIHTLQSYKATVIGTSVKYDTWNEGTSYPDVSDREFRISKDEEGNWTCSKTLTEIDILKNNHPKVAVSLSSLGITPVYDDTIATISLVRLPLTGIEEDRPDSDTAYKRYIFTGTYDGNDVTVIIGPTDSSNITVNISKTSEITIPDKLPNPNVLTFTGAATGSYDGSAPLEVNIPSGGGESGLSKLGWKTYKTITVSGEDVTSVEFTDFTEDFEECGILQKSIAGTTIGLVYRINDIRLADNFFSDFHTATRYSEIFFTRDGIDGAYCVEATDNRTTPGSKSVTAKAIRNTAIPVQTITSVKVQARSANQYFIDGDEFTLIYR